MCLSWYILSVDSFLESFPFSFLKTLYCDDPLVGIVLDKFTLKQQIPKEKSDSYWTC